MTDDTTTQFSYEGAIPQTETNKTEYRWISDPNINRNKLADFI